jgi:hypothetical protein
LFWSGVSSSGCESGYEKIAEQHKLEITRVWWVLIGPECRKKV